MTINSLMVKIKRIVYGEPEYYDLLNFRYENLRKPLNLNWSRKDLYGEKNQIHFAIFINKIIIGSCLLKKINSSTIKIRQMAIDKNYQKKGFGKKLIKHVEKFAKKKRFNKVLIVARTSACRFYKKNGYQKKGRVFIEVKVNSIRMSKSL
jgi:histone acetyltransferase (RNA polymerase elongator complex component)